jgi:hypothetical protein
MISSEPLFSFKIEYKNVCQLEGSDHGGRDSAAELALAGIDVQTIGRLLQPADFGVSPLRREELYTSEINSQRLCAKAVTIPAFRTVNRDIKHGFPQVSSSRPR